MKKSINILSVLSLFFLFSSCNFSTANIDNVKMCTSVNDNQCAADTPSFSNTTPFIYISCDLNNAPENTQVKMEWAYLGEQRISIDAITQSSGSNIGTVHLQSNLSRPNNGWPSGDYEVVITILDTENAPIVKKFSVQ